MRCGCGVGEVWVVGRVRGGCGVGVVWVQCGRGVGAVWVSGECCVAPGGWCVVCDG